MFYSARIKLTLWYLVIIMAVSGFFSLIAYRGFVKEIGRGFHYSQYNKPQRRLLVQERNGFLRILPFTIYPEEIAPEEYWEIITLAKRRFALQLGILNGMILVIAGTAGYFLAGKTLRPIEVMVSEQKRFVADASHELRTPLTSMKTEVEVALRDKKLNLKEAKALLNSNLQEIDKMKEFTDYLLSLSRYEANGKELPFEKVNLADILEEAIFRNYAQANAKKIEIFTSVDEFKIKGNYVSLLELFSTLINNAIKYSKASSKIEISAAKNSKLAIVEVKDYGLGISENDIPHIFDRFYRADASRSKQNTEGFGLGLAIAKSIAEIHKGEIKVKSKVGKGTTFKVYLPIK